MVALNWNQIGEKFYETGVDKGVFYPKTGTPAAWNGLVSVTENISGGDLKPIYLDGKKVFDFLENEDFSADVEAFSAPAGFRACDGILSVAPGLFATQQPRATFGLSYRTRVGTDINQDHSYKIHLVYNATASPSGRSNNTLSDTVELTPLKWSVSTVPPPSLTYKPTSHLVIDVSALTLAKRNAVETLLYGSAGSAPQLPTQASLIALLTAP